MNVYGCASCWPPHAPDAFQSAIALPIRTYLVDESHYIVSIRVCPACAQRFLHVTTETVDWRHGEDPCYRTILPIEPAEHLLLTAFPPPAAALIESIGPDRRSLRNDSPSDNQPATYWSTGVRVGEHD